MDVVSNNSRDNFPTSNPTDSNGYTPLKNAKMAISVAYSTAFNGYIVLLARISQLFERIKPDQVPEEAAKTRCGGQWALAMQKLEPFMSCLPRDNLGRPCCTAEMHGRDARLVIGVGRTAVIMRCAARKA